MPFPRPSCQPILQKCNHQDDDHLPIPGNENASFHPGHGIIIVTVPGKVNVLRRHSVQCHTTMLTISLTCCIKVLGSWAPAIFHKSFLPECILIAFACDAANKEHQDLSKTCRQESRDKKNITHFVPTSIRELPMQLPNICFCIWFCF